MLLRRVIEHVKAQNWTAVALDFVIVVLGVFIGIQVSNWNAARADRHEYVQALARYREELKTNLAILDKTDRDIGFRRATAMPAFDALLTCEDSPENRALIDRGLIAIAGTTGLRLRDSALRELTESQRLLSQESDVERKRFADTKYLMTVFLSEAQFLADAPLTERMENNPILVVGPMIDRPTKVAGVDYTVQQRSLKLSAPIDIACQDNALVKSFYTWERWQSVLPSLAEILRKEFEASLERIEE